MCVCGGRSVIYSTVYSFVGRSCFIRPVSGKRERIYCTLKLKTYLGEVGEQASPEGKEERTKKRKRRAVQWTRLGSFTDERDIEFHSAHACIYTAMLD